MSTTGLGRGGAERSVTFWRAAFVVLVCLACSSQVALAQIVPPGGFPPPGGPTLKPRPASLSALKGVHEGHIGQPLTFQWTQYSFSPLGEPAPSYFVVCVFPAILSCASASFRWMVPAASVPRTPIMSGTGATGQVIGHAYSFELPDLLWPSHFDRQLLWTVGSCASGAATSCSFAAADDFWLSTKNVVAVDTFMAFVSSPSGRPFVRFLGQIHNRGSAARINYTFKAREVLYDDATHTCRTDVTSAYDTGVADRALSSSGEELDLSTLARLADGALDVGDRTIVAVYPSSRAALTGWATENLAQNELSMTLDATLPRPRPAAFATHLFVDDDDRVVEFDEADNHRTECHVVPAAPPPPQTMLTAHVQNGSAESLVQSQPTGIVCTLSSLSDCTESYPLSSSVTLRALPLNQFVGWSGCDSVSGHECEVVMSGAREVTAEFEAPPAVQL